MKEKKVYIISDIHGRYDLFDKFRKMMNENDICYVIGDCGDRGPDGWKVIKEVIDDNRFIYIMGNHEDMMINSFRTWLNCNPEEREWEFKYCRDYRLTITNGGAKTFEDFTLDKDKGKYFQVLKQLPYECEYINKKGQRIIMTHAGYTPSIGIHLTKEDYLWDRTHFNQKWDGDYLDTIIVHGHTPIPYMDQYLSNEDFFNNEEEYNFEKPKARKYCGGHKINIDNGAFFTNKLLVLDADTLDSFYVGVED